MEIDGILFSETFRSFKSHLPPLENSKEIPLVFLSKPIIKVASILIYVYLIVAVLTFLLFQDQFSGTKTNPFVDAIYFSIVTMCTVGYGDIVPVTSTTKILTTLLVIIGVIFLNYMFKHVVSQTLTLQEKDIINSWGNKANRDHIINVSERKMYLAFGTTVFFGIGVGILFLYLSEQLDLLDSVYLSVISITTVGYGDITFETAIGRLFASVWIFSSSISMTGMFYYFVETRINSYVMKVATSSESMYIVMKLIEIEKISEDDIKMILREVRDLDCNN